MPHLFFFCKETKSFKASFLSGEEKRREEERKKEEGGGEGKGIGKRERGWVRENTNQETEERRLKDT